MVKTLYMATGSPPVCSVLIAAKALGLTFESREIGLLTGEHMSPEYLKLNPQHTVPTLDDDGVIIWDSHAINAYLVGKYGKDDSLYPRDLHKRAIVDQRLHFDTGILFPVLKTVDFLYIKKEINEVPQHLIEEITEGYGFLEQFLEGGLWAAGDTITIADINLFCTIISLNYHVKVDPKTCPNISAWMKRCIGVPYFDIYKNFLKIFVDFFDGLKQRQ